jgi:sensor histidine kinase YesM
MGDWILKIDIWKDDDYVYYVVEDNGMGANEELIRSKLREDNDRNDAIALNNVNKRIKYKYGEAYGIKFYSQIGVGTRVLVRMPISGEDSI